MRAEALLAIAAVGCGSPDPCDLVRDQLRTDQVFVLTAAEHAVGWGDDQCFACHQTINIHNDDCIDAVSVDLEAIRELSDPTDVTSCASCHGANGVSWLEDALP